MQIIQSHLGSQSNPLGLRPPLADAHRFLLKKGHSSFIEPLATQSPLVKASKFLLARKHKPFLDQLIDWDNWDNQDSDTEFPGIALDNFDAIQEDSGNYYNGEDSKANIQNILPTRSESYSSNEISPELNVSPKATKSTKPRKNPSKSQTKSSSKTPTKSQTKSTSKSPTKKSVKSSVTKKVEQVVDEIPTLIHHEDNLLIPEQPLTRAPQEEIHKLNENSVFLENDINVDNHDTYDGNYIENSPIQTVKTSPVIAQKSTVFRNIANDEPQVIPESPSTLPSAESSTTVNASNVPQSMTPAQQKPKLDSTASDLAETSPIEPTSPHVEETHTLLNNLANNEQPLLTEASLVVHVSDIPVSPTSLQQEIVTSQIPAIADNQSTAPPSTLIQKTEVTLPQAAELLHINSSFEENTAIEPDLISNSTTNDAVIDNAVAYNYGENVPLSLTNTSPSVEDTPTSPRNLANDEQPVVSELPSTLPSAESATTVNTSDVVIQPLLTATNSPESSEVTTKDSTLIQPTIADLISNQNEYPQSPETPTPKRVRSGETLALDQSGERFLDGEQSSEDYITSPENLELTAPESTAITPVITGIISPSTNQVTTTYSPVVEGAIAPIPSPENTEVTTTDSPVVEGAIAPIASPSTNQVTTTYSPVVEGAIAPIPSPENTEVTTTDSPVVEGAIAPITSPSTNQVTTTDSPVVEGAIAPITSPENTEVTTTDSPEIQPKIAEVISPQLRENPPRIRSVEPLDLDISVGLFDADTLSQEVEQNTVLEQLPAPQGYATGGQVTASSVENHPQIASSDTVPAMLTPGEFVINATDAQKNLHLLRQINSGATPENLILPSVETPNPQAQPETTSPETPTKVDTFGDTSIQRQNSDINPSGEPNSFTPSSLGEEIGKQRLSMFSSPQLNTVESTTNTVNKASTHYSSPTLIFRKPNPTTNTTTNAPSQWSSVEELLHGNNDEFTSFNFGDAEYNWQNSEFSQAPQSSSTAPQIFTKRLSAPRGFANGGEVTAPDISRDIQPITETIENPSVSQQEDNNDAKLEILAHEIYHRLRQRIEIERERHGIYLGRLPW